MAWTKKHTDGRVTYTGHIVDPLNKEIYAGDITINGDRIESITRRDDIPAEAPYYMPGFIDGHVHVESSMMLPVEFARLASQHGTVGAICDPHEIANVIGIRGIELMLNSASQACFNFAFGCPSCVPSCPPSIETSGCAITSDDVRELMKRDDIVFLGEFMNVPGVLNGDPECMAKIRATLDAGKPVDGHAPGLTGDARRKYAAAGISTDHECSTLVEGRDAVAAGMIVQIREGSAAKDYAALSPLIAEAPGQVMLCTDDSHPTDLVRGHINRIVQRALADGYDLMDILQAACITPVKHYKLPVGLLQVGDQADFISVDNLTPRFRVLKTIIRGEKVYSVSGLSAAIKQAERTLHSQRQLFSGEAFNTFNASPITASQIERHHTPQENVHVIVASDGSLITGHDVRPLTTSINKMVVMDRYTPGAQPQVGYVMGFGLKHGAWAQSIAHDCHNIIAVGTHDDLLVEVINRVIKMGGGIAATDGTGLVDLPLPVAGLITAINGHELAFRNMQLEEMVRSAGCPLNSPFITLGFMALPVIPHLKLTDRGLLDTDSFRFITQ